MRSELVTFRVSPPRFKRCLEEAAARERRSQTNMPEKLVLSCCHAHLLAGLAQDTSNDAFREGMHGHKFTKAMSRRQ